MGKKITQLATITEVADDDLLIGVDISDTSGSDDGTNKKFTKASLLSNLEHGAEVDNPSSGVHGVTGDIVGTTDTQTLTNKTLTAPALSSPTISGAWDGWISAGETWTYASADDPTFTFTVNADVTGKYSAGMKIKLTQGGTVKYFIITAVSAFAGGNTTITVYGGTDYDLANSAISANAYSMMKSPQGFPMSPAKWSVETTDTTSRGQSNPSANTYYSPGDLSIVIPIGVWKLQYQIVAQIQSTSAVSVLSGMIALSTSTTSPSDTGLRCGIAIRGASAPMQSIAQVGKEKVLALTSKTTYYPIFSSETTLTGNITFRNDLGTMYLTATCAYL